MELTYLDVVCAMAAVYDDIWKIGDFYQAEEENSVQRSFPINFSFDPKYLEKIQPSHKLPQETLLLLTWTK